MTPAEIQHLSQILSDNSDSAIFLSFEPEAFDFTDPTAPKHLLLSFSSKQLKLNVNPDNLAFITSLLKLSVFSKNRKVIVWDWKTFASYFLYHMKKTLVVESSIVDIKVVENYFGIHQKSPTNLKDALQRLKRLLQDGLWKDIESLYKNLYLPLMTYVLPAIETTSVLDLAAQSQVYAHYEINGQDNGRLRCAALYAKSYVPHAMSSETKENLKPRSQSEIFLMFDYKGMEVCLLAWLSKDPVLLELAASSDVYSAIFEKIIGKKCQEKKDRELAKKFFLPVIYGQSARSLADRCGMAHDVAEKIVERIEETFSGVSAYISGFERQVKNTGYAKDFFGKRRKFEQGKEYMVRNFAVQAPGAVLCLDKLNQLYFALKGKTDIAYTVHDGYAVYAARDNWKQIYKIAYDVLSSESQFCPDLRLRVTCRAGRNLNDLKSLSRRGD